jgi:hypothetical protein
MVIQMTRAEYERKYGVKPVFSTPSNFDISPAPRAMTREQYNAEFRPKKTEEAKKQEDWRYKTGEFISESTPVGLLTHTGEAYAESATRFGTGYSQLQESMKPAPFKEKVSNLGRGMLNVAGATVGAAFAPITGAISWGLGLPVVKQTVSWENPESALYKKVIKPASELGTDNPLYQSVAQATPQDVAENTIALGLLAYGGKKAPEIKTALGEGKVAGGKIIDMVQDASGKYQEYKNTKASDVVVKDLTKLVETKAALRNNPLVQSGAAQSSFKRIANTDVLVGSVDESGSLKTTGKGGPIDQYYRQTILGKESIVTDLLAKEGATVNLAEIERDLGIEMANTFVEADLTQALKGVKVAVDSLRKYADVLLNIPLAEIQKVKIGITSNLDYTKPLSAKFRKAKARTYKTIIENKSKTNVKEINTELAKYYRDLEILEMLNGAKVEGGRLGKHLARLSGQFLGGAAGAIFGPAGAAVGGMIGGEATGFIKGKAMSRTFGRERGITPKENAILEQAKAQSKLPATVDLRVPDLKAAVPPGIPKTKEMFKLERQIAENVEAQKAAIKKGDFNLVKTLKEVYKYLVGKLSALVKAIKETPNKQGGFIKIDDYSNNLGNRNTQYNKTNKQTKTDIGNTLSQKGAEIKAEGVQKPTIKLKRDVTATLLNGEKVKIPEDEVLKAYESGGKILLKDGREYIVSKNQYENIKNNSKTNEVKEFAPELKQVEETVKGDAEIKDKYNELIDKSLEAEKKYGKDDPRTLAIEKERKLVAEQEKKSTPSKYSQYQLPGGKNYKEVLIRVPIKKGEISPAKQATLELEKQGITFEPDMDGSVYPMKNGEMLEYDELSPDIKKLVDQASSGAEDSTQFYEYQNGASFKSSHWDEPNVISHLRLNERTVTINGKEYKVSFGEEYQSDWQREGRSKGFIENMTPEESAQVAKNYKYTGGGTPPTTKGTIPNNPLLKNWLEMTIKRHLIEAVNSGADYMAWISGEQTAARYNLSKQVESIKWNTFGEGKNVDIKDKSGNLISIRVNKEGIIEKGGQADWKGKPISEAIGKGIGEQIATKSGGNLSGEGLNIGGEWANTLYDKQVKNIVEDLTGQKVEVLDMKIPVDPKIENWLVRVTDKYAKPLTGDYLRIGKEIGKTKAASGGLYGPDSYIITDVLGDGKFKAVPKGALQYSFKGIDKNTGIIEREGNTNTPESLQAKKKQIESEGLKFESKKLDVNKFKETFDISTKKSAGQQAIKITPEIKALVKGEKPKL